MPDGSDQYFQPLNGAVAVLRHQTLPLRRSIALMLTRRLPFVPACAQMPGVMASPHTSRFGMPEIRTAAEAGGAATSAPARTARTARRVMTCMIPGMDAKEIIDANRYMTLAT